MCVLDVPALKYQSIDELMNGRRCVINNPFKIPIFWATNVRILKASLMRALNVIKGARSKNCGSKWTLQTSLDTRPHTVPAAGLRLRIWFYPTALGQGLSQCVSFYVDVFCDKVHFFMAKIT